MAGAIPFTRIKVASLSNTLHSFGQQDLIRASEAHLFRAHLFVSWFALALSQPNATSSMLACRCARSQFELGSTIVAKVIVWRGPRLSIGDGDKSESLTNLDRRFVSTASKQHSMERFGSWKDNHPSQKLDHSTYSSNVFPFAAPPNSMIDQVLPTSADLYNNGLRKCSSVSRSTASNSVGRHEKMEEQLLEAESRCSMCLVSFLEFASPRWCDNLYFKTKRISSTK
ncbi:hypothetical protein C8J56DRAFT_1042312 [Mycena floridula]|nr:hypothetical protein C8J56DRAFT_1042312 [Mycena floridula]